MKMYKVLIVEDEEMIRKGLHYTYDWLARDCIVVGEAKNGKEGLEKIEELKPDIALIDINMPIMNGITMLEKSIEKYLYSAIIISGYDEFDYAKSAIKLGVSEYLLKPIDEKQLFEAVDRAKKQIKIKKQYEIVKNKLEDIENVEVLRWDFVNDDFKGSKHVMDMIKYAEKNYKKKISLKDMVELTGMSDTYLNQKFKEETSYTFNDFLNRYRIQKSINMLKTGEEKIYNIASDVGFSNYRYFIAVFKKYTNLTPSEFLEYFRKG
jgi:two-component system response regulator YesN